MKKTLAAVAVLGAFAGSALAADVTLYGRVDTGFQYNHVNPDIDSATDVTKNSFKMEPGQSSGSRWGLKGVEDLGSFKVGFVLEDGFASDTGAEIDNRFDRESSLFIEGAFGKLAVGHIGSINGGTGSFAQVGAASVFGTSYGNAALTKILNGGAKYDNMVTYQTPTFAGVTGYMQYGMGDNGAENESSTNRYYAAGATYKNGPLVGFFSVDSINYKTYGATGSSKYINDSLQVTAAVNYNFDVATVYFGAQYFDEVANGLDALFTKQKDQKIKGYGVTASVAAPVAGGKLMAAVGYKDASAADSVTDVDKAHDFDLTRYQAAVGYNYSLSKRTSVYAVASMLKDKVEYAVKADDDKLTTYQAMFGLLHTF